MSVDISKKKNKKEPKGLVKVCKECGLQYKTITFDVFPLDTILKPLITILAENYGVRFQKAMNDYTMWLYFADDAQARSTGRLPQGGYRKGDDLESLSVVLKERSSEFRSRLSKDYGLNSNQIDSLTRRANSSYTRMVNRRKALRTGVFPRFTKPLTYIRARGWKFYNDSYEKEDGSKSSCYGLSVSMPVEFLEDAYEQYQASCDELIVKKFNKAEEERPSETKFKSSKAKDVQAVADYEQKKDNAIQYLFRTCARLSSIKNSIATYKGRLLLRVMVKDNAKNRYAAINSIMQEDKYRGEGFFSIGEKGLFWVTAYGAAKRECVKVDGRTLYVGLSNKTNWLVCDVGDRVRGGVRLLKWSDVVRSDSAKHYASMEEKRLANMTPEGRRQSVETARFKEEYYLTLDELADLNTEKRKNDAQIDSRKAKYRTGGPNCRHGHGQKRKRRSIEGLAKSMDNGRKARNKEWASFIINKAIKAGCERVRMVNLSALPDSVKETLPLERWPYYHLMRSVQLAAENADIKFEECESSVAIDIKVVEDLRKNNGGF